MRREKWRRVGVCSEDRLLLGAVRSTLARSQEVEGCCDAAQEFRDLGVR